VRKKKKGDVRMDGESELNGPLGEGKGKGDTILKYQKNGLNLTGKLGEARESLGRRGEHFKKNVSGVEETKVRA